MTGNSTIYILAFTWHIILSYVMIVDGSICNIIGYGTVKPTSSFTLSCVLGLQKLAFNLMSVRKFTRDLNNYISLFPDHCLFHIWRQINLFLKEMYMIVSTFLKNIGILDLLPTLVSCLYSCNTSKFKKCVRS